MALLFIDGFDHYTQADVLKKWSATNSSFQSMSTTLGRRGGGAMLRPYDTFKNLDANKTALIVGFAWFTAGFSSSTILQGDSMLGLGSGAAPSIYASISSAGEIFVHRGQTILGRTKPGILTQGAWAYIEVKCVAGTSAGAIEIRVNGILELQLNNINVGISQFATINFGPGGPGTNFLTQIQNNRLDDLYVLDTSGDTNNDFLGDCRVDSYFPTSEGAVQEWTPVPAGVHYTTVDEVPVSGTDYVETSTSGAVELFGYNDLINTPLAIFGVQVNSAARKTDAGSRSINNATRIAGANYFGPALTLSDSTVYRMTIWDKNPASNEPWAQSEVNLAEFGVRLV
jgi:hypothetical protein